MHNTPRRQFLLTLTASTTAWILSNPAQAQTKLDAKDPQAVALGYVADATQTDSKKHSKYAAGQSCADCALFREKTSTCPLFTGKQVAAKGWCSAWTKKG